MVSKNVFNILPQFTKAMAVFAPPRSWPILFLFTIHKSFESKLFKCSLSSFELSDTLIIMFLKPTSGDIQAAKLYGVVFIQVFLKLALKRGENGRHQEVKASCPSPWYFVGLPFIVCQIKLQEIEAKTSHHGMK